MNESTNSITTASGRIVLTDDDRLNLLQLGKLKWSEREIAVFFGWDPKLLKKELEDPNGEISMILLRGELIGKFEIEARLQADAAGGNLTAAKQFTEIMRERSFTASKLDIFGGAESEDIFEAIQDYFKNGGSATLGNQEQTYLEILQIIYSFDVKCGKRATIRILTKPPYNMSYDRARDLHAEAIELFNSGRKNSKEAMRYHMADTYDTLYHLALEKATSTKDVMLASGILEKKNRLLRLNQPDEERPDERQYLKQIRLLSTNPESIGLPSADRDALAAQIDALDDLPAPVKQRLKMDAGIIDMDIQKILEDGTQEES